MTHVHGSLWLVTEDPASVTQVVVRAHKRRTYDGGLVTTLSKAEPVTDSKLGLDMLPGPAFLTLISHGRQGESIPIVVPDADTATLESVIKAAEIADTTQRDILAEIAAQITADREAVAADRQAVAQDKADISALTGRAETAAGDAETHAELAEEKAGIAAEASGKASASEQAAAQSASDTDSDRVATEQARARAVQAENTATGAATTAVDKAAEAIDAADRAEQATSGKADIGHTHTGEQITDATASLVAGRLIKREETSSAVRVGPPDQAYHAAPKSYVDDAVSDRITPDTAAMMISQAITGLVGSAPQALDTVYELAAYLTDPGIASGLVQQLAGKSDTGHKHTADEITDLQEALDVVKTYADTELYEALLAVIHARPAWYSGEGSPPATIYGAVLGDRYINELTGEFYRITGV